jgi:hypothetical protein
MRISFRVAYIRVEMFQQLSERVRISVVLGLLKALVGVVQDLHEFAVELGRGRLSIISQDVSNSQHRLEYEWE